MSAVKKIAALTVLVLSPLIINAQSETIRIDKYGRGASEFEATKDAYKQILRDSIAGLTGSAVQDQVMQTMIREVEEDIRRIQSTFLPQSAPPSCAREADTVECLVVASVQLNELETWVNQQRSTSRSKLKYGLTSAADDSDTREFMKWLHAKLQGDYGYDVLYVDTEINAEEIQNDCKRYRSIVAKNEGGSSSSGSYAAYKASLKGCERMAERDVLVRVEKLSFSQGEYQDRDSSISGSMKLDLTFFDINEKRILPSPEPRTLPAFAQGESAIARSQLKDKLYLVSSNYVSQQFNDLALNINSRTDQQLNLQLVIRGLSRDERADRDKVSQIRSWIKDAQGLTIKQTRAVDSSDYAFSLTHVDPIDTLLLADELRFALDDYDLNARVDTDQANNITLSFTGGRVDPEDQITWKLAADGLGGSWLRRGVEVQSSNMRVVRRDQDTGVEMAVNEAYLSINNPKRNSLRLRVTPTWYDANGIRQQIPFDDTKIMLIQSRNSTGEITFRAPNRLAQTVELTIDCVNKGCK